MNADELNRVSHEVIGAAYAVSNTLGGGFLEKVYENALAHELRKRGLAVEQQKSVQVIYDGVVVGDFVADLLVEREVLVELKSARIISDAHAAQGINYLKATGLCLCLILNFGCPKVETKRLVNNFPL